MKRLVIGLVVLAATGCTPRMEVSEETWTGGPWPLTVDRGELSCERGAAVFFTSPDGRIWPLTGLARTVAQQKPFERARVFTSWTTGRSIGSTPRRWRLSEPPAPSPGLRFGLISAA